MLISHNLLEHHGFFSTKPISTLALNTNLSTHEGGMLKDSYTYHQIVGALQLLTFTCPDISYAINLVAQFLHDPHETHFQVVKYILHYIHGTLSYRLQFSRCQRPSLVAYSNIDWVRCPDTWRSTSNFCIFLGSNLISQSTKKLLPIISRSSSKDEYHSVAFTLAETI